MKLKLARWVHRALGEDWGGNPSPPGSTQSLRFGPEDDDREDLRPIYVAATYNNDGHELWLGTSHKWHVFYADDQARRLAWFILWNWWIVGTWCGLKRRIWYWALHEIVEDSLNRNWSKAGQTPAAKQ